MSGFGPNDDTKTVANVRGSDGSIVGVFTVGQGPIGFDLDGGNIWSANADGDTVTML